MRGLDNYPINYDKTLVQAKKEVAIGVAIDDVNEIENRWVKLVACEDYSLGDLKKETLLMDIEDLIRCCIIFINKITELEALVRHQKPKGPIREARRFPFREET